MDNYQAVYDAVRSRVSNGDIGAAVEVELRTANVAHHVEMVAESIRMAASTYERPSAVYRPALSIEGDQWCALYGEDLQSGVAGFGDSPADAMTDFDNNWFAKLK